MIPTNGAASTIEELEKRVAVLERKAAREKKARNSAERQLEQYSLEIYQTNQSLKVALASSTQKQAELEYLSRASSDVASEFSLSEMIANVVDLTGRFCSADYGCYVISEDGIVAGGSLNESWCAERGWQESSDVIDLTSKLLPLDNSELLIGWNMSIIDNESLQSGDVSNRIFYTNFNLTGNRIGWVAFLTRNNLVDDNMLSALGTAHGHLVSGVRRRLTDVRILKRNQQLQESLEKLENARRQLIQSEKMASLGQLAAGVAHEINNPVAFIRSNMEVLQDYLNDYKQLHKELKESVNSNKVLSAEAFKDIYDKVDIDYIDEDSGDLLISNIEGLGRVKEIVDNLKSFSHSGDEKLVAISLADCIDAALKVSGNVFKYEHQIDNQMSESCPLALGNLGQLQQVFVNLFVNAAYAMEGGGQLTISYTEEDDRVVVHVSDSGCGMDKDTISQLFTPFFTTKPVGVGTGLGLSVSYAILEAHGAQVTVDSELGMGTTFNLSFPIVTQ